MPLTRYMHTQPLLPSKDAPPSHFSQHASDSVTATQVPTGAQAQGGGSPTNTTAGSGSEDKTGSTGVRPSSSSAASTAAAAAAPVVPPLVISNTHICFDPSKGNVKLGQVKTLFNTAAELGGCVQGLRLVRCQMMVGALIDAGIQTPSATVPANGGFHKQSQKLVLEWAHIYMSTRGAPQVKPALKLEVQELQCRVCRLFPIPMFHVCCLVYSRCQVEWTGGFGRGLQHGTQLTPVSTGCSSHMPCLHLKPGSYASLFIYHTYKARFTSLVARQVQYQHV